MAKNESSLWHKTGLALTLGSLMLLSLGAPAHRMPECLTVVTPLPEGKGVEIVHRLHRHDVEVALAEMGETPTWDLDDLEVRAVFAMYLESHFALAAGEPVQRLLPLELVGAEVEDDYLLVYQELAEALPAALSVRSEVLQEIFPRQVNLVHVRTPQGTQRLTFAHEPGWQRINVAELQATNSGSD
ncbi:MAG: DUF6702 family protein [Pseudomonadales bacterium]